MVGGDVRVAGSGEGCRLVVGEVPRALVFRVQCGDHGGYQSFLGVVRMYLGIHPGRLR